MSAITISPNRASRKPASFVYFLWAVFCLFIGILICTYVITKRTHPIFLDEHGQPVNAIPADNARH